MTPLSDATTGTSSAARSASTWRRVGVAPTANTSVSGKNERASASVSTWRVEEPVGGELIVDDLFFEHRMQHDRAGAGGDETLRGGDVVGERRGADDERAAELEAEPVGREVNHRQLLLDGEVDLGELLVEGVAATHGGFARDQETLVTLGVAQLDHPEPGLLFDVLAQRDRGRVGVDDERRLTGRDASGVEAVQRPRAAVARPGAAGRESGPGRSRARCRGCAR